MKVCANITLLYPELPFIERFGAAAADGFNAVEIQFPYDTSLAAIQHELQQHQLRCVLINVPAGDLMQGGEGLAAVPERQAEFHAALEQCVEFARGLQVDCVNVLPGRCNDEHRRAEYLTTLKNSLQQAVAALAPLGITTTFEAINTFDMPGFLIHSGQQMLDVMDELQLPGLKAQFDVYHMARMGVPLVEFIRQHIGHIGHIQFADTPGRGEPGTGELDFAAVFAAITESGYSGWVGAEYRPTGPTSSTLGWLQLVPAP